VKPYQRIPIQECGEPLVALSADVFSLIEPHPYAALGAPYGDKSPFLVRQSVCDRLLQAQQQLQRTHPDWRIQIFDAYRPIAVQQFMVDYTFTQLVQEKGLNPKQLTAEQRAAIYELVLEFWAIPSADPATPPPHSTGAAIDVTFADETGLPVDMGSPIDEVSPRSYPDYFANGTDEAEKRYHQRRTLLRQVMTEAGFIQHPNEWWHFSFGDQMWAWRMQQAGRERVIAQYGAIA